MTVREFMNVILNTDAEIKVVEEEGTILVMKSKYLYNAKDEVLDKQIEDVDIRFLTKHIIIYTKP